jgi:KUP system potassium uptake protein
MRIWVITGAFSLTRQAMHLDMFPRLTVNQTSAEARGQIYMPAVNWTLMVIAIGLVLAFRTSGNLAAAYGVAVNATMATTTVLAFRVVRERGGWHLPAALAFLLGFLAIDLGFLGSNLLTIPDGGWLPLVIGAVLFSIMTTWWRGSQIVGEQIAKATSSIETFMGRVSGEQIPRIPGTAVFFAGRLEQTPSSLLKLVRHTGVVYENVILLTVVFEPVATTGRDERMEFTQLGAGFYRIVLHYGFMQTPNIPSELSACSELGLELDLNQIQYIIGRVDAIAGRKQQGMALWRDKLFAFMARNTLDLTATFHIPAEQVMMVGLKVGI